MAYSMTKNGKTVAVPTLGAFLQPHEKPVAAQSPEDGGSSVYEKVFESRELARALRKRSGGEQRDIDNAKGPLVVEVIGSRVYLKEA